MSRATAVTLLRAVRVAVQLGMLSLFGNESFGLAFLLLAVDLGLCVGVWQLRHHGAASAPNIDMNPALYVAGLCALAVTTIAAHPDAVQIPLGQPDTPNAAYVAVLLAAMLPAIFIDSCARALYRWIRVSLAGQGRKPWTTTTTAVTAAAGSITILALRTPPAFEQELGPAVCVVVLGLIVVQGLVWAFWVVLRATVEPAAARVPQRSTARAAFISLPPLDLNPAEGDQTRETV